MIDTALRSCITESRPAYIEISIGVSGMQCDAVPNTPLKATPVATPQKSLDQACAAVFAHMQKAKRLVLMAGSDIARAGVEVEFATLCQLLDAPYVSSGLGKSVLAEDRSDLRFAGTYIGKSSQQNVQDLIAAADCFFAIGVQDTDFNYLGIVTPDYDPNHPTDLLGPTHLQARDGAVMIGRRLAYWGNVSIADLIPALIAKLQKEPLANTPFPGLTGTPWDIPPTSEFGTNDGIKWDSFKSHLVHGFLNQHNADTYPTIVADSGFSFVALTNVKAAARGFVAQLAWAAIGYGTGATTGVALAQSTQKKPRRVVTVAGDAAFAETVNAIGFGAQLGQDNVIFVMDNRAYAVEQWLLNPNAFCPGAPPPKSEPLTDVPQGRIWDYVKIAEGFGGAGHLVTTNAELSVVLGKLQTRPINPVTGKPTFTLVAVRIPAKDLPDVTRWKMSCPTT